MKNRIEITTKSGNKYHVDWEDTIDKFISYITNPNRIFLKCYRFTKGEELLDAVKIEHIEHINKK